MKFTPSKGKKEGTPQKGGKISTKKPASTTKKTPAMPSPGGKKSTKTTDQMTMAQFKQYLNWHEQKKGGKQSSSGKVLGKRSAGGASGKSSAKGGKRSKK